MENNNNNNKLITKMQEQSLVILTAIMDCFLQIAPALYKN